MPAAKNEPLVITRRFAAPRALVWECYSKAEHLKNWWGPKGFTVIHCTVDFRVGGAFHYGLQSPNGQVMWGKWTYREITAPRTLGVVVEFSDEKGGVTAHPFAPVWPLQTYSLATFTEDGGETVLHMTWDAEGGTPEQIEAFAQSHDGMKAGCEGTFSNLDAYLKTL